MRYNIINIYITAATLLLCSACTDEVLSSGEGDAPDRDDIITVGANIEDEVVVSATTRADVVQPKDAEKEEWLVQPLMKGLDITYGNIGSNGTHENKRVAILKLQPKGAESSSTYSYEIDPISKYAKYSFNYRAENGSETDDPARWYDNGYHFFEGVHVPYRLRFKDNIGELATDNREVYEEKDLAAVTNLTTDQHNDAHTGTDNDLGNYTLLAHYLGMPANTRIAATVARIKLPFRHRLCRVLAYILIDPELKTNGQPAKIKGYANVETDGSNPFRDDPTTSSIRFCNVDVLGGVHDEYNETTKLHTLTPKWSEKVRKVVPHFQEQLTTFKTKESGDKVWFENSSNYSSAPSNAIEKTYNNVPVYDLIVRPTYTSADNVMYDEDLSSMSGDTEEKKKQQYAAKTNQIDFTVSLDNGLTYEKHVTIDLDANYQTIVYLRITHEGVDYNESGSEKWTEKTYNDLWYGVDNQNGNTLSKVGSSWQRAFYNRDLGAADQITDGGFYDEDTQGEDGTSGQYVSDATWIKNFAQACEGGAHHGDYFVLAKDITIDARSLPDNFVFTGHLDGFNTHGVRTYHTITLTGAGQPWKEYIETTDYNISPLYDTKPAEYSDELVQEFALPELYTQAVVKYDEDEIATACAYFDRPSDQLNESVPGYMVMKRIVDSYPDYIKETVYDKVQPTIADVMNGSTTYYIRSGSEDSYTYAEYQKPLALFTMQQHTSGVSLFAGLDGIYETNQERGQTPWQANVHKEGSYWLPYRDVGEGTTNTGWRAEVMNLTIVGGTLFKESAEITGNVSNCKYEVDGVTHKVEDHTPAMPKYK